MLGPEKTLENMIIENQPLPYVAHCLLGRQTSKQEKLLVAEKTKQNKKLLMLKLEAEFQNS